jgi:hypothetical protein
VCTSLGAVQVVIDRRRWLVERCRGRRIVHIGCAAGEGDGQRLHDRLAAVAATIVGVDIDMAGLERMPVAVGGDLVAADVGRPEQLRRVVEVAKPGGVDLIIAGEVIEHVPDAASFVSGLLELSRELDATVLLTTINTTGIGHMLDAVRRRERVHPEHHAYYSLTTLRTALMSAGLQHEPLLRYYVNPSPLAFKRWAKIGLTKLSPAIADGIIAEF